MKMVVQNILSRYRPHADCGGLETTINLFRRQGPKNNYLAWEY